VTNQLLEHHSRTKDLCQMMYLVESPNQLHLLGLPAHLFPSEPNLVPFDWSLDGEHDGADLLDVMMMMMQEVQAETASCTGDAGMMRRQQCQTLQHVRLQQLPLWRR